MPALSRRGALAGVAALAAGAAPAAAQPASREAAFIARAASNIAGWERIYAEEAPWFEIDGGAPPEIHRELQRRSNALMEERIILLRFNVQTLPGLRAKAQLAALFVDESDDDEGSDFFGLRRLLKDINRLLPA
jgi:hypothetical protein